MSRLLLTDPLPAFDLLAPRRVVSLVPSWTNSLFELGVGDSLVAITDYCLVSETDVVHLERIGGPKSISVEDVTSLKPDLVIANQEENSREAVEALAEAGLPVWLTFPKTVRAMLDDLFTAASLFRSDLALEKVQALEQGVEWAEIAASNQRPPRVFSPIWQDQLDTGEPWWMTFNWATYSNDVLRICGGMNVFADRNRRYPLLAELGLAGEEKPGDRDTRYPRVGYAEIIQSNPELVLLPDEPFDYSDANYREFLDLFAETTAVQEGRVFKISGSLLHWPGTRLARALSELPSLLCM